jgi:DNA modification methylase
MTVRLTWDGQFDAEGKRVGPVRIALPFQTIETVNESSQQRAHQLSLFTQGQPTEWRNRLIWGDKKYVLPSLLPDFAGKVNLIYIDPPFATGADFSFTTTIPDADATLAKAPSLIEQKAYRDTWGRGLDGYLQWFYETVVLLHQLLAEDGSIYVHLDWHVGQFAKVVIDEIFGMERFRNEIVWHYENKLGTGWGGKTFDSRHDIIYIYSKNNSYTHHPILLPTKNPKPQPVTQKIEGERVWLKDDEGNRLYAMGATERPVGDVWDIPIINPVSTERLEYPTQKPEALLERIIRASSNEGDLVLDCFCGSGTTAAVAEKLGRRWITCDLGRFAIHTARKRLLGIPNVRPFVVQNLGKYERQAWQGAEFGQGDQRAALEAQARYRRFILDLYHAQPVTGYLWLHGLREGRWVHVGSVDAPVAHGDLQAITREFWKAQQAGTPHNEIDVLGWDFGFETNETFKQQAERANIHFRFKKIPREVLEKKAVDQGDIVFYELAALSVAISQKDKEGLGGVAHAGGAHVTVSLTDFIMPPDGVAEDAMRAVKHWSQWIDYWAVDWDARGDAFHNMAQTYRTRKDPTLQTHLAHTYTEPGTYQIVIKVIDILGNDTTKTVTVTVG